MSKYFPLGGPVQHEDVVDREAFAEDVVRRLVAGEHILLAGPRRVGKTSLALEIQRRLKTRQVLTGYVDLFVVTSLRDLAEKWTDAVYENVTGLARTAHRLREVASGIAAGLEVKAALGSLDLAVNLKRREAPEQELFEEAVDVGERVATQSGRRLVMVLDEFQDLSKLGTAQLYKLLRGHLQHHHAVSYLFLGSEAGIVAALFSGRHAAFYRFALPLPIPDIPDDAWASYITDKYRAWGLGIRTPAIEALLEYTGGHPQDTMLVASEAFLAAQDAQADDVTMDLIELGHRRAMAILTRAFEELWGSLRVQRHAQELVKNLAAGERAWQGRRSAETARILALLINRGILVKVGRGRYRFVEPMFQRYARDL